MIRQRFKGYRCELNIRLCKWWVTKNFVFNPLRHTNPNPPLLDKSIVSPRNIATCVFAYRNVYLFARRMKSLFSTNNLQYISIQQLLKWKLLKFIDNKETNILEYILYIILFGKYTSCPFYEAWLEKTVNIFKTLK